MSRDDNIFTVTDANHYFIPCDTGAYIVISASKKKTRWYNIDNDNTITTFN